MNKDIKNKKLLKQKILSDPDFIYCPRLGNSLQHLLDVHVDGVNDERIAKILLITPQKVNEIFQNALKKIRKALKLTIKDK